MEHTRVTLVLAADQAGVSEAARLLRAGRLVAFPTETVYGLGAHALNPAAVAGIFAAKGRPANDPLIVHLADADMLKVVARELSPQVALLAERFWPGPLTLIVPKTSAVPASVTAGLDNVAVRVPAHPVARALLRQAGVPVAAPSANLFSRPSPTRAEHVLEDLQGRIDAVLDGGATSIGLESTIVDLVGFRLLRPGGVPLEEIEAVLGRPLAPPEEWSQPPTNRLAQQLAPGLLPTHYAPRTPFVLVLGESRDSRARLLAEVTAATAAGQRVGVLALQEDAAEFPAGTVVEVVGTWEDPAASASRIFDALRSLDRCGLDVMYARTLAPPASGLGRALADRLRRAAVRQIGDP